MASSTPLPVAPEISSGVLRTRLLKSASFAVEIFLRNCVDLVEGDDLVLLGKERRVGLEFLADHAIGGHRILAGHIDEVKEHRAALDMAEEARAQSMPLVCTFDEAGNVSQHEAVSGGPHDAQLRMQAW